MGPISAIEPPHNRQKEAAEAPMLQGGKMFSRKISAAALGVAAMFASPAALAQVSDDIVKIGVLTDMNGPAATPTGQGSVTAAQMAIDDFGGKVLGKPISIIVGDHQLKPDIGGALARRWYDVDQVDLDLPRPPRRCGLGCACVV